MSVERESQETYRVVSLDLCVKALAVVVAALVTSRFGPGLGAVSAVCGLLVSEIVTGIVRHLNAKRSHVLAATGLGLFVQADSALGGPIRRLFGDQAVNALVHGSSAVAVAATTTTAVGLTAAVSAAPLAVGGTPLIQLRDDGDTALTAQVSLSPDRATAVSFEAEEGRRVLVHLSAFQGVSHVMTGIESGGQVLREDELTPAQPLLELRAGEFVGSGEHRVVLGRGTGSVLVRVYAIPDDVSDELAADADGETTTLTTGTPGQRAHVTLTGPGGRTFLQLGGSVPADMYLGATKLDGDTAEEPVDSERVVNIDPEGLAVGEVTLTAYAIPADVQAHLALGEEREVTTTTPGQNIDVIVDGGEGERAQLRVLSNDIGDIGEFPRDVEVGKDVIIDPEGAAVGRLVLVAQPILAPAQGFFDASGNASTETTAPGQSAELHFAGVAGDQVSIDVDADFEFVATLLDSTAGDECFLVTLPDTGDYTVSITPRGDEFGAVTAVRGTGC